VRYVFALGCAHHHATVCVCGCFDLSVRACIPMRTRIVVLARYDEVFRNVYHCSLSMFLVDSLCPFTFVFAYL